MQDKPQKTKDSSRNTRTNNSIMSSPALYALQVIIFILCIVIFILFVIILSVSVHQFMYYKIVEGTLICSGTMNRCVVYFNYMDPTTNTMESKVGLIGYNDIGETGTFSVKVAYHMNETDTSLTDYFIVGSRYHLFLGTTNMIIVYSILSFIMLVICICMGVYMRK